MTPKDLKLKRTIVFTKVKDKTFNKKTFDRRSHGQSNGGTDRL